MNIAIVGAGLGGLAAALAVKCGAPEHDVLVIEAAQHLAEVGKTSLEVDYMAMIISSYGNNQPDRSRTPTYTEFHQIAPAVGFRKED